MSALFAATAGGASTLQNAGSIAAIVGASVAVVLLTAGIVRWWLHHRRVWSVKPRVYTSGETLYLGITGLPASTKDVTAFVSDGKRTKRLSGIYYRDIEEEHRFGLRVGEPTLDESVKRYKVEIHTVSNRGEHRRVFKRKVRTPW